MPTKEALLELADRCEKATGPDRELDVEVWLAVTDGSYRKKWSYTHSDTGRVCEIDETRDKFGHLVSNPEYTSSLDATLTLVPEGMIWLVRTGPRMNGLKPYAHIGFDPYFGSRGKGYEGEADTPALATIAAALRAIAAIEAA